MKRVFLLGLTAVTLAGAVMGGVTLALMSATMPASSQALTAGTVQIDSNRDQGDWVPGPMFYIGAGEGLLPTGVWAPGDTVHRVLQVENTGSLDVWLNHVRATLTGGGRDIADQLEVRVTTDAAGANMVAAGTLGQFVDGDQSFLGGPVAADVGDVIDLHFWVSLPLSTGNTYQGLSATTTFAVYAEQRRHNP